MLAFLKIALSMTDVPISSQGGPTITLYRGFQVFGMKLKYITSTCIFLFTSKLQKKFEFHFRVRCAIEENSCKPLKLRGVLLNFAVVSVKIPFYLYYYFEEQKYDSGISMMLWFMIQPYTFAAIWMCLLFLFAVESAAFQYSLGHHHFVIVYPLNGNDSAAK